MEIWVNPACSKCRSARDALDAAGIAYTERRYLDDPPTEDELAVVLDRLGLEPWHVARDKEALEEGVDLPRDAGHRNAWLAALAAHPRVLQRPIITADDGTTVVGRDRDAVSRVIAAESEAGT